MKSNWGDRTFRVVNAGFLILFTVISFFPIYFTVVLSFTDPVEYYQKPLILFPEKWSFDAYHHLLSNSNILKALQVSGFLASVGTLLSLLVTSGIAYAISRKRLKYRRVIMLIILFTIIFTPGLIPSYMVVREMGLIDSIWALIVPTITSGWYVLLMKGFFDSLPESLEEAAFIDGANDIRIFFSIVLPLSLPALVAFGLFYAVGYWNTFFNALMYMNSPEKWPLQVLLQNMLVDPSASIDGAAAMRATKKMPTETLKMAAVVITTLPIMLVYPFLQKHFAKGALIGSVKG
ncbi:carbohydrate ABC transporter permease [Paenibacillus sp. N1-5-1-14]|uniref:carbohydrate ABC transporter permease n=1 Tax=Paenibacillus radicibacter TaxID=2972488 RepID=UPI002159A19F|nr:carbohydrate ABC transporter permease [Paenibacillus radicibacter]MCR8643072.1 carbohydrate ABC transporter permease [Paenibacillus radicibacter]